MKIAHVATDILIAPVAGYLATKAMEPVGMSLYKIESKTDRAREDAVRPGPPYTIAAKKRSARLGSSSKGTRSIELACGFTTVLGRLGSDSCDTASYDRHQSTPCRAALRCRDVVTYRRRYDARARLFGAK